MDSREIPPQPPSHNQLQPPPGMLMTRFRNLNAAAIMGPTSTSQSIQHHRLPFGNLAPHQQQHHPQQSHQQQQMDQKTLESLGFGDGSPSSQPMRFGLDQNQNQNQQGKKKRGRPRKYTPDGSIALGLAPTSPLLTAASNSYGDGAGVGDSGGGGNGNSADPPAKRNRGRPPGSSKKQLDALGGTAGVGFTPHVIEVKTGEDIASKIKAFTDQGPRTICILSASGAVARVTLRQASQSNGTATYEGRFEIITLSGSFMNSEVNGSISKTGSLSVALAGPDGRILGGCVVGSLIAATQVQVIVGSFVAEAKKPPKQSSGNNARGQNPEPASAPANMLNFGSASQGPSSESSGDNESGSSMHRDNNNEIYGTQQQQQQQQPLRPHPMQQMYHVWPNHGQ